MTHMRTLSALVIACAVAAFTAQPVAAQTAKKLKCNGCVKSKQIKNNSIAGKDLKPGFAVGTSSDDGDLHVKNVAGRFTVSLDGATGNVTNRFSNTAGSSNGLVKAWATISANGSIASCWRCNTDPTETGRRATGVYEVDFTPLASDIRGRPRSVTFDTTTSGGFFGPAAIFLQASLGDFSSVVVSSSFSSTGVPVDNRFTILIY